MIKVSKIRASEILSFADESKFIGWEHIPISTYRAISYAANPRSNPDDVVLYLAHNDNELVGYRTIMPDLIFIGDKQLKVGWLSGNWVLGSYRRQGIALLLLDEALKDWNNHLLYTNYALESKAVYDKSGKFEALDAKKGQRFYLRSSFSSLLPQRSAFFKKIFYVLKAADMLINLINPLPFVRSFARLDKSISFEFPTQPDNDISEMFELACNVTPTRRSRTELLWFFQFPWLVSSPEGENRRYYFSSNPKRFEQLLVKVKRNDKPIGFFILNLHDDKLAVPYCYFKKEDSALITKALLIQANRISASTFTVYEPRLIEVANQNILYCLFSRKRYQNYFATKEIVNELRGSTIIFNDGDGDCAFV